MKFTDQEWDAWARNPVTEAFKQSLLEAVEEIKELWATGNLPFPENSRLYAKGLLSTVTLIEGKKENRNDSHFV